MEAPQTIKLKPVNVILPLETDIDSLTCSVLLDQTRLEVVEVI
jgi:hypothetical protein